MSLHNKIPAEASNFVNLAIYRTNRDAIRRQRFVQTVIEQQSCNVDHLCASIANIARLCVIIADLRCNIDDPRNAQYVAPLRHAADEELASFLAAGTVDALELEHFDDPHFNVNKTYAQCLIHARRMAILHMRTCSEGATMIREIARLIDGAVLKVSCVVEADALAFPPEPIVESLIEPMTLVDAMSLGERLSLGHRKVLPASQHHSPYRNGPYLVRRSRRSCRRRS